MTGYIYKITNLINENAYIGKTVGSIESRWREHQREALQQRAENRPLYRAINKYGAENFSIELVEEVDIQELSEKEIYWIGYYDTYKNGYNATLGGDGKILYDYDLILELILQNKTNKEITALVGCCEDVVQFVVKKNGLTEQRKKYYLTQAISVKQFDKEGNYLRTFTSCREAARWLKDNNLAKSEVRGIASHIKDACTGKRKTAYKFLWQFSD